MSHFKKQTVLQGVVILAAANVLVKVLGALFKIPLARLIGTDGMGLFNTSYTLYTFMFVVATAGFPVAVSKMVAEAMARRNRAEADKIFYISLFMLGIIGAAGSLALFFFAEDFAELIGNSRAYLGIEAIAPAVFFIAVASAFRGYFQGLQNMYPTAFSELFEAFFKLAAGYFLAERLMSKGVVFSSAGAVLGVTVGTAASLVFLAAVFLIFRLKTGKVSGSTQPSASIWKELIRLAVPITIGAAISSLTNVVDLLTVMNRLQVIDGITEKTASELYGLYSGYAVTLFNLPLTIIAALSMSVVPGIASNLAKSNKSGARKMTASSIRLTLLFAIPCAVGLSVMSETILDIVYKNTEASYLLSVLAVAVVFVSLLSVTNAILQAYGKMHIPVINMVIGGIIKVYINYNFIPVLNIIGAPIATNVCYFVIVVLNFICISKLTKLQFGVWEFYLKPIAAAAVMASVIILLDGYVLSALGVKAGGLLLITVGAIVYGVMLLLLRAVKAEDIKRLPMGGKISDILLKLRLID